MRLSCPLNLTLCHRSIRSFFDNSGPRVQSQAAAVSIVSSACCWPAPCHSRRADQVGPPSYFPMDACSHSLYGPQQFEFAAVHRYGFAAPPPLVSRLLVRCVNRFAASASAHGRDPAIVIREIASAATYNRGMSGSALRAGAALGPDVSPAVLRVPRDEPAAAPQTRVDHLVSRLGAGLAAGSVAFAGAPPTAFARSFASPGSAGRTPSASNRPPEDSLPVSITPSAAGADSLYLVESLTQPGTFTCHRCVCVCVCPLSLCDR
jgi:hypothetical protein